MTFGPESELNLRSTLGIHLRFLYLTPMQFRPQRGRARAGHRPLRQVKICCFSVSDCSAHDIVTRSFCRTLHQQEYIDIFVQHPPTSTSDAPCRSIKHPRIDLTCVCPGQLRTDLGKRSHIDSNLDLTTFNLRSAPRVDFCFYTAKKPLASTTILHYKDAKPSVDAGLTPK